MRRCVLTSISSRQHSANSSRPLRWVAYILSICRKKYVFSWRLKMLRLSAGSRRLAANSKTAKHWRLHNKINAFCDIFTRCRRNRRPQIALRCLLLMLVSTPLRILIHCVTFSVLHLSRPRKIISATPLLLSFGERTVTAGDIDASYCD